MVNITLAVPNDMKRRMDSFAEINWSAVARQAFQEKMDDLEYNVFSQITQELHPIPHYSRLR